LPSELDLQSVALNLQPIYCGFFLAEFDKLAGGLFPKLRDVYFKPSRRYCEFRAQQILVGLEFSCRKWHCGFQPPHRQPYRAIVDEGNDGYPNEDSKQKADS
jgi:hypothetical protein